MYTKDLMLFNNPQLSRVPTADQARFQPQITESCSVVNNHYVMNSELGGQVGVCVSGQVVVEHTQRLTKTAQDR